MCAQCKEFDGMRHKAVLMLFWLLLVAAGAAHAEAPPSVFIADLTWTELRELIAAGHSTIIIPIGGTEENGPHMVLGKHNVRVAMLSERIARDLSNALVAPVIAYVPEGNIDPPSGHMGFPGTITIPTSTFETLIEYAARSMKAAGFRDIVFLGDHGSYQASERTVADRLNRQWANTNVRAHAILEYYRTSYDQFNRALESKGYPATEVGTHAGLADTSLALAVSPSLVRQSLLRPDEKFGPANGVYGDPRRASAALGEPGIDAIVKQSVAAIRMAVARR
jgi:creatinine amidohydrolase/Fe(II)-dependent formamide hydrolase-like protein